MYQNQFIYIYTFIDPYPQLPLGNFFLPHRWAKWWPSPAPRKAVTKETVTTLRISSDAQLTVSEGPGGWSKGSGFGNFVRNIWAIYEDLCQIFCRKIWGNLFGTSMAWTLDFLRVSSRKLTNISHQTGKGKSSKDFVRGDMLVPRIIFYHRNFKGNSFQMLRHFGYPFVQFRGGVS